MPDTNTQSPTTDRFRWLHNALRALALTAVLLTLTAGTAAARPMPSYFPDAQASDHNPTVVRVVAPTTGFDWGDAGIGAAGGLAIALIALGGTLVVARLREHHISSSIG